MDDIVTDRSEGILSVELNRPEKLNAMTSSMYTKLADIFNDADKDERIRVVRAGSFRGGEGSTDGVSGKASS